MNANESGPRPALSLLASRGRAGRVDREKRNIWRLETFSESNTSYSNLSTCNVALSGQVRDF